MDKRPSGEPEAALYDAGGTGGAGAPANRKPHISKIISAYGQIEAAGDTEAFFLGHSAKQINHLFSYAA